MNGLYCFEMNPGAMKQRGFIRTTYILYKSAILSPINHAHNYFNIWDWLYDLQ